MKEEIRIILLDMPINTSILFDEDKIESIKDFTMIIMFIVVYLHLHVIRMCNVTPRPNPIFSIYHW